MAWGAPSATPIGSFIYGRRQEAVRFPRLVGIGETWSNASCLEGQMPSLAQSFLGARLGWHFYFNHKSNSSVANARPKPWIDWCNQAPSKGVTCNGFSLPIRKVQTTNLTFASSCAYGFPWFSLSCLLLLSKVQHKIGPEPGSSVEDHFGCLPNQ